MTKEQALALLKLIADCYQIISKVDEPVHPRDPEQAQNGTVAKARTP